MNFIVCDNCIVETPHQKAHAYSFSIYITCVTGYRGAQCSWLVVNENNSSNDGGPLARQALCLCVYLSKRGLLEVQYVYHNTHVRTLYSRLQEKLHVLYTVLYVVLQLLISSDGNCAIATS